MTDKREHRFARGDDGRRLGAAGRLRPAARAIASRARRQSLAASDLGCLLLFDPNNLRYVTSTAIGTWERDKNIRFALVFRDDDPILWDFGSAARHHQLYCPWLPESSWRAWVPPMRGAMRDETGVPDALAEHDLDGAPRARPRRRSRSGWTCPTCTTLLALQRKGLEIADSQPVMLEARKLKSEDELALLDQAAGIVDAAYETIYRMLRPGVRESQVVAAAMQVLFELGSEHVEAINAISGDRCNPHPHTFSDRLIRPGRPGVLRHHPLLHGLPNLLLPHVQRGLRDTAAARRLQAVPRVAGQRDRARPPRRDDRQDRRGLADGAGDRDEATSAPRSGCSSGTGSASGCTRRR